MNTGQILRQALLDVNAVRQNSTTDPFYTLESLLTWATIGKNKAEKALRSAREDHNFIHLQSDDAAFRWCGITYDPASLALVAGTRRYQLPPDLLLLKTIRPVDESSGVSFIARDATHSIFRSSQPTDAGATVLYYDVVGEATLLLNADPPGAVAVEIEYVPRTGPLQLYTTGTVTLVQTDATVAGAGTTWVIDELRTNLELIVSADATAPKITGSVSTGTWVDPSGKTLASYPVSRITNDTELELAGAWLPAGVAGRGYMLATVPSLPEEHHQSIVDYVAYRCLRARRSGAQATFKADFGNELAEMRSDVQPRQEQTAIFVEDWEP